MTRSLSLYIHIPFCQRKCHYCDFNTYAGMNHYIAPYLAALHKEIANWAQALDGWRVETIFFGGGTPSLLSGEQVRALLDLCRDAYTMAPAAEVTLEANPGTVDLARLEAFRAAGVNRLSFGAQSFDPAELQWLGRIHARDEIGQAVRGARQAGFGRVNLDLIYGLPEQPLERWQRSVEAALALDPDHLSLYALTVEEGTPLAEWVAAGRVREPDPDNAADHYLASAEMLERAGYLQYEISNWAKPGQECRHNLTYWHNDPYLGLGAGAHSCVGGCRFSDALLPQEYIRRMTELSPSLSKTKLDAQPVLPFSLAQGRRSAQDERTKARNLTDIVPSPLSPEATRSPEAPRLRRAQGERGEGQGEGEQRLSELIPLLSPTVAVDVVDPETDLSDTLILGLRLSEGVAFERVRARHGVDVPSRYRGAIGEMQAAGLLAVDDNRMWLTPDGRLLANEVFLRFLPE